MASHDDGRAAGYVLAGGASRRMGRDKARLEAGGVPLLVQTARAVEQAAGNCRIVAPAGRYEELSYPVLADLWPGEGPLGGVVTAIERGGAAWSLIVAVDLPMVEPGFLAGLLAEARQGREAIVPVRSDGQLEPLCAVYPASALEPLQRYFAGGGRRMMDALRKIAVRTVPAPERLLANVNTPADWEAARV